MGPGSLSNTYLAKWEMVNLKRKLVRESQSLGQPAHTRIKGGLEPKMQED